MVHRTNHPSALATGMENTLAYKQRILFIALGENSAQSSMTSTGIETNGGGRGHGRQRRPLRQDLLMVNPDGNTLRHAVVAMETRSKRVDRLLTRRKETAPPHRKSSCPSNTVGVRTRSIETRRPIEAGVYCRHVRAAPRQAARGRGTCAGKAGRRTGRVAVIGC